MTQAGHAPARRRRDIRTPLVLGAVVAAATLLLALRDPRSHSYVTCPVLSLTGWQCAGCGGLRTVHDLATGDLAGAFATNPLLAIGLPLLALAWAVWLVRAATARPSWNPPLWLASTVIGVMLVFSVLRNVPALAAALGGA